METPDRRDDRSCVYPLDGLAANRVCGEVSQARSSYCPRHHALCHLAEGSRGAVRRLREIEVLANVVGGRSDGRADEPSAHFIARLERALRGFARPKCS